MWTNSTSNLYRVNEVHNSLRAARVDLRIATCDCGYVRVWGGCGHMCMCDAHIVQHQGLTFACFISSSVKSTWNSETATIGES